MSRFSDLVESIPSTGGMFFKAQLGDNKVRIVSEPQKIYRPDYSPLPGVKPAYCLTEKGAVENKFKNTKFVMWIIDRADGTLKAAEFGPQIMGQIADLSDTDGYKFDTLPPYDLIIKKKKNGDKTEYAVIAYPTQTALTSEEEAAIKAKGDIILFLREKAEDAEEVPNF